MINKLNNLICIKDELVKRIDNISNNEDSVYNKIYLLETLEKQLFNTEFLINREVSLLEAIPIVLRKDVDFVNGQVKELYTNINNSIIIKNKILCDDLELFSFTNDIDISLAISDKKMIKVYGQFNSENEISLKKGKNLGYLIPKSEKKKIRRK